MKTSHVIISDKCHIILGKCEMTDINVMAKPICAMRNVLAIHAMIQIIHIFKNYLLHYYGNKSNKVIKK